MTNIEVNVTGQNVCVKVSGPLTSGTVGLPVALTFDDAWEGLAKTAVFRAGSVMRDVVDIGSEAVVPWEVMQKKNCMLQIGIYGVNADGTLVMPTVWADVGIIAAGADPAGDESADPTQPVWQQTLLKATAAARAADFAASEAGAAADAARQVQAAYEAGELKGDMPEGAILYTEQELTFDQKRQARGNIGALGEDDKDALSNEMFDNYVSFTEQQQIGEDEQLIACQNIQAVPSRYFNATVTEIKKKITEKTDVFIATYGTTTLAEMEDAYNAGKVVFCLKGNRRVPMSDYTPGAHMDFYYLDSDDLVNYYCEASGWGISSKKHPVSHASNHATDGSDPITPESIGAVSVDDPVVTYDPDEGNAVQIGEQTTAQWRSLAAGYQTKANNTSFAAGRLAEATGKGSFAIGLDAYENVVDNDGNVAITNTAFHIDESCVRVYTPNPELTIQVGDFVSFGPSDTVTGFTTTDAKRVTKIEEEPFGGDDEGDGGDIYYITTLYLNAPFRADNYYEGWNAPEDGYIPSGAVVRKVTGCKATGEGSQAEGKATLAEGEQAHAEGKLTQALGANAHAEGLESVASGAAAHAEGYATEASGAQAHAEGNKTKATGLQAHAEGTSTEASGDYSHAEGKETKATNYYAHAEGFQTQANRGSSHAEGRGTIADSASQHVQGQYNVADSNGKYLHIVGNGSSDTSRSNAHTLDWNGNAWFAGTVECTAMILLSPDGTRFKITVSDSGALSATAI